MAPTAGSTSAATVLDAEHVAFMARDAISSAIAARGVSNQPSLAKSLAVRVLDDRRTVEVFVDSERAVRVLRDVGAGSPVAIVCSEPSTHRTIQVKGPQALIEPLASGEDAFVRAKVAALVSHIVALKYAEDTIRMYLTFTPAALVKVVFVASAAFLQTPGPGAGAPLKS